MLFVVLVVVLFVSVLFVVLSVLFVVLSVLLVVLFVLSVLFVVVSVLFVELELSSAPDPLRGSTVLLVFVLLVSELVLELLVLLSV